MTAIPVAGQLARVVFNPSGSHIYISNPPRDRIEDYSVADCALAAPIPVGHQPDGFDITPDGSRLYVANSSGHDVSVVDLATRQELERIDVPSGGGDFPYSLVIAGNGKAFISTDFEGQGYGARMLSLDLATKAVSVRGDFDVGGVTSGENILATSSDRSTVAAVSPHSTPAPVFIYRTSTDQFSPAHDLDTTAYDIAVSPTGDEVLVGGVYALDATLNLIGTVPRGASSVGYVYGVAFAPNAEVAYRAWYDGIDVIDIPSLQATRTIPVPDKVQGFLNFDCIAVSPDGRFLAVLTTGGLTLVSLP